MGIKRKIVLYTHTSYSDVWDPMFSSLKTYLSNYDIILCLNEIKDEIKDKIPNNFQTILYNDSLEYTERLKQILSKLKDDVYIFMHEDMFLIGKPKIEILERYYKLIESQKVDTIKLIPVGNMDNPSSIDNTLFKNEFSKFSIQPTILSKETFVKILKDIRPLNIWEFENEIKSNGNDYVSKIGNEQKIGKFHYNSLVFPYVATAINKGKWNFTEYEKELKVILEKHDIDKNLRGTI